MTTLPTAVYAADHGYAWLAKPDGLDAATLDLFLSDALSTRPDFAEENAVTSGVVMRNGTAAAFSIRRARAWDAVGRDADYAAFAFAPSADAANIDFGILLRDPFFSHPTHTPPDTLTYEGPAAADFPIDAPGRLLCHNRLESFAPSATGSLLAQYGAKADHWLFIAQTETFTVTTSPWHR